QSGRVAPHPAGTIVQDNNDHFPAGTRAACDQTFAGRFGITGLHPVAVGESSKKLVRVLKFARATIGIAKNKLRQTNNRSDRGIGVRYAREDRKSTRLNSSHVAISYAVFCLKKKK